ncbi:MAG: phosphatase PAP2 family protein [Ignavibacteriales bacterium]|nr:phosphatase PAP2 family protein [Ignavibacteriales bacterium]MBP9119910.1 phosphatase PAP2 family protein [Ignavibacterium sp.]
MNWKEFLKEKRNRFELVITLFLLAVVLTSLANFLNYVEARKGVLLPDPLLNLFNPIDLTWLTFALIYVSLIVAIATLSRNPKRLLFAVQLYTLMVAVRILAMYLLPLQPPEKMIILNDPLVEFFGTGQTLTKDLFFSGHTATLLILFLVSEKKIIKTVFLISTITVAIAVLLQHVHYSIDVLAAVFFTYACYRFLQTIKKNE